MAKYNLVIIGAGPGGYVAAIRGAQKGLKVAVVEKGNIGGCCLNLGCVPTKSLMNAAHLFREIRHADKLGITAENVSADFSKLYENKNNTVASLRGGVEQLLKANKVDVYRGLARITGANTINVELNDGDVQLLDTENILIAVGSKPQALPGDLMDIEGVYTSDDILGEKPVDLKRVLIIGAGVIALEFASLYSDLGREVTVAARGTVLRKMDKEISQSITMIMKKRGVKFETNASLKAIERNGDTLSCTFLQNEKEITVECDGVIAAMGRAVNTADLFSGMEPCEMDGGAFVINEYCQTNIPNIYAIGDCTKGSIQLAHAASAQGINVINHLVGEKEMVDTEIIPSCMYTDPEIAVVGLSADDAKKLGITTKTGKYIMSGNAKSVLSYQERGFVKVVFNGDTDEIIGAQLMCARATDIIGELTTAVSNKLKIHELTKVVRPHPTFEESITEAVEESEGLAIHLAPKRKP